MLPPPIKTAYFWAILRPGIVLRVSKILAEVLFTKFLKCAVDVAVPESSCKKFNATLSPIRIEAIKPSTTQIN